MRKLALAVVLVLVLVGGGVGGWAVATVGAAIPTLTVSGNSAPGTLVITGQNWTPGVPVDLWMDSKDEAHHVAVTTPNSVGRFVLYFPVGKTTLGDHQIIAKQGANTEVVAPFIIKMTQQVDDRTWVIVDDIKTEVNNIEGKLDNSDYGLDAIDNEVEDIEAKLDNEIARFEPDSWEVSLVPLGADYEIFEYDTARHISVTFMVDGDPMGQFRVGINIEQNGILWPLGETIDSNGVYTFEFDAAKWRAYALNDTGAYGLWVMCNVTTIYAGVTPP